MADLEFIRSSHGIMIYIIYETLTIKMIMYLLSVKPNCIKCLLYVSVAEQST